MEGGTHEVQYLLNRLVILNGSSITSSSRGRSSLVNGAVLKKKKKRSLGMVARRE